VGPRWRAAFRVVALRLRALASLLLAMERRLIAFTKAQDYANDISDYSRDLRPAKWGSGVSLHGSKPEPLMSALGQKRTLGQVHVMSALPQKRTCDRSI
jgi:hypothetical protein